MSRKNKIDRIKNKHQIYLAKLKLILNREFSKMEIIDDLFSEI